MIISPARWAMLPGPLVPKLIASGLARAAASSSARFLYGEAAGTTSTFGPTAVSETAMKSFSML